MSHRLDRRRPVAAALLSLAGPRWSWPCRPGREPGRRSSCCRRPAIVDHGHGQLPRRRRSTGGADGAAAVVIKLNTPGGSLDSTSEIVGDAARGEGPGRSSGSPRRAASRPAPGRSSRWPANLAVHGARHADRRGLADRRRPGKDIPGTLGEKVKNDAIAWITSIAQARHRPVDWAVSTVADGPLVARPSEAVALGAVDGIASTIDGRRGRRRTARRSQVAGSDVVLDLAGAPDRGGGDQPVPGVPPPAGRPEHRVPPVHGRLLRRSSSSSRTRTS